MYGGGRTASPPSCILQTFVLCYKNAHAGFATRPDGERWYNTQINQKYIGNMKQTSISNKSLQTLRVDLLLDQMDERDGTTHK